MQQPPQGQYPNNVLPPFQQYPQGPYMPGPSPQPPKKKHHPMMWVALTMFLLVVAVIMCSVISMSASSASQTSATTSTDAQPTSDTSTSNAPATGTWTTTHTYSGNGIQKTGTFTAPDDWKLLWTCDPASFGDVGQYNVIVTVTNADGSIADIAVNALCKAGQTSGSTEEHQGGSVYLDVNSEGTWGIKIQELK